MQNKKSNNKQTNDIKSKNKTKNIQCNKMKLVREKHRQTDRSGGRESQVEK